jgi:hypothetical protein
VAGPDAERRLLVARLVAAKLTPATAPMRPRPASDLKAVVPSGK